MTDSMTYTVVATQTGDFEWRIQVSVFNGEEEILSGETSVCVETEEEALEYGERVFLPDLRTSFPRKIGELVFAWETKEEPYDPDEE